NPISAGSAAAASKAIDIIESVEGKRLLANLKTNVELIKKLLKEAGFRLAVESRHPIQAVLIGDAEKTRDLTESMYGLGYLITNINYPVVPRGRDEIRVQLSAAHTEEDIGG